MNVVDIILFAVYLIGYIGYIAFTAYIADPDDRPAWVFIGLVSGSIWFVLVPFLLIGFFADFE